MAWDYARTIFGSEKLQIAYIKAEIGTGKHLFLMFRVDCMVMHTVFMLSMCHDDVSWLCNQGYVSWICILAMYFEPESRPAGAFWAKYLVSCESKVSCKFSKKKSQSALNHVLIL